MTDDFESGPSPVRLSTEAVPHDRSRIASTAMVHAWLAEIADETSVRKGNRWFRWISVLPDDQSQTADDPSLLYLCTARSLGENLAASSSTYFAVLCKSEAEARHVPANRGIAIVSGKSLFEIAFALQGRFCETRCWLDGLSRDVAERRGYDRLLSDASIALDGFISFADSEFNLVASAGDPHGCGAARELLVERGRFSRTEREHFEALVATLDAKRHLDMAIESDGSHETAYFPLSTGGVFHHLVSYTARAGNLREGDADTLSLFVRQLSLLCDAGADTGLIIDSPHRPFFCSLIERKPIRKGYFEEQLERLGLEKARGFMFGLFKIDESGGSYARMRILREIEKVNGGNNFCFPYKGDIAVVSYTFSPYEWKELGIQSWNRIDVDYLRDHGVKLGTSSIMSDIRTLDKGYQQALIALNLYDVVMAEILASSDKTPKPVCPFIWAMPYYLISGDVDPEIVDLAFDNCPEEQVYQEDLRTGSHFTHLLWTYLCNGGNVTATAKELFMHRNSVHNQIKRFEDRFGGDLSLIQGRNAAIISLQRTFLKYNLLDSGSLGGAKSNEPPCTTRSGDGV